MSQTHTPCETMFCYQCEQTAKGTGCTVKGVCGKDAETAAMQDLLVHVCKGISQYAHRAAELGARDEDVDVFLVKALFVTLTNVNFDAERIAKEWVRPGVTMRERAKDLYEEAAETPEPLSGPATFEPGETVAAMCEQATDIRIDARIDAKGQDVVGLKELVTYGVKGAAAYADHAHILGKDDPAMFAEFHRLLREVAENGKTADALLGLALDAGALNLKAMELLDAAHNERFGHPEPTKVRVTPVAGKAIVVSGHDLDDLKQLLEQTEGTGINVYTHGEMLPAHGYPELKKHAHLVGNYGGAWQDQQKEFDALPGAVLMTTNCIMKPRDNYAGRIFTTGVVAWPGVTHIEAGPDGTKDFTPVIEAAKAAEGFAEDAEEKTITVGFGHHAVLGVADTVVEAVKGGAIRHFFLIGGCDGAKPGRNYYTKFAEAVPDDCVIMTLACGKYRFNKLDFGTVAGLPRLLDIGQCNDAYSAVKIATALAEAFGCGVNELPLSLVLSWYEQKAVAILLTLLYLGVRDIRLGPSLPAFVTPAALDVLVQQFNVQPISTVEADLEACLA